jgi:hypothetical protein
LTKVYRALSSSSALLITVFLAVGKANDLRATPDFRDTIVSREELAAYLSCVENGSPFRGLAGDTGVGTLGGSQDHTAILTSDPGKLASYSWSPLRREASVALPEGYCFAIASSGVAAEKTAGVKHHVALSVVQADRMPDSGYMRAKVNQESVIKAGGIPYTIVRATQFFEFLGGIADSGAEGDTVRLSTAPMQPIAGDDVGAALADVAVGTPANATIEMAGPEAMSIADFVGRFMAAKGDKRKVIADPKALYYGAVMGSRGIAPGDNPRIGPTRFDAWIGRAMTPA